MPVQYCFSIKLTRTVKRKKKSHTRIWKDKQEALPGLLWSWAKAFLYSFLLWEPAIKKGNTFTQSTYDYLTITYGKDPDIFRNPWVKSSLNLCSLYLQILFFLPNLSSPVFQKPKTTSSDFNIWYQRCYERILILSFIKDTHVVLSYMSVHDTAVLHSLKEKNKVYFYCLRKLFTFFPKNN